MSESRRNQNIVLIGFMGTGKSTVAHRFSTQHRLRMIDTDQVIAKREGMSIGDIFATYGEEHFRKLETRVLMELQYKKNVVISCGGGMPLRFSNVQMMKAIGPVVLLTANPETIYERVRRNENRPILAGRNNISYITELMEQRSEKYKAAADFVIATDGKTVAEICEELRILCF